VTGPPTDGSASRPGSRAWKSSYSGRSRSGLRVPSAISRIVTYVDGPMRPTAYRKPSGAAASTAANTVRPPASVSSTCSGRIWAVKMRMLTGAPWRCGHVRAVRGVCPVTPDDGEM
jgi:hypothetical protein